MLSAGALIWISCRPLIRLILCASCGFIITKLDIFPAVAARGAGQIILNITLPSLLFSKIVSAFTSDNIHALGPLVLVAVLYEAMGVLLAWIVKQFFWVPHRFRYGILVAGGWGNVGDIPTSVIMSVVGAAPFNGTEDQNLAIAYISAFILVFMVTLFPLGGHNWIAMDNVGPDIEPDEVREMIRIKRKMLIYGWPRAGWEALTGRNKCLTGKIAGSSLSENVEKIEKPKDIEDIVDPITTLPETLSSRRQVAFRDDSTIAVQTEELPSLIYSSAPTEVEVQTQVNYVDTSYIASQRDVTGTKTMTSILPTAGVAPHNDVPRRSRWMSDKVRSFLKSLFTPASLSIFIAFPIALIPKLKALFVEVPNVDIPPAPDGQPPLAFLMDTATFIGGASIPIGLICLGSALARLQVPVNQWRALPIGAISWLAIGKIIVMPILGVSICEGFLLKVGFIPRDDKVLRFVCIFFSCLPTATTQVYLTQVYNGTGDAQHLSAFLIPQYILMFISMTALTAYAIQLIF